MYGVTDVASDTASSATTILMLVDKAQANVVRLVPKRARISLPRNSATQRALAIDSVVAKVARNYVLPDVARRVADSPKGDRQRASP